MKVAVVMGGPSAEAEVSRVSGRAVLDALESLGHETVGFELHERLGSDLLGFAPDVVFPIAHGALGEDGCLQGLLEILGLPYVGAGVLGSAAAADKGHAKRLYRTVGLPVAEEWLLGHGELRATPEDLDQFWKEARERLGPEIIAKPNTGGSAVGATRLLSGFSALDLLKAVQQAQQVSSEVLLESYVRGVELTCGVLDLGDGPIALPPTLVHEQVSGWYDFESKYGSGGSRHECPAPLPAATFGAIQEAALSAHRVLGLRDFSRSDFILADSKFIILETNTLPGMTKVSLFPEAAQVFGIPFPELIGGLVERAAGRRPTRPTEIPAFPK